MGVMWLFFDHFQHEEKNPDLSVQQQHDDKSPVHDSHRETAHFSGYLVKL